MEPVRVCGKRRIVAPGQVPGARAVAERACAAMGCPYEEHPSLPKKVA